MQTAQQARLLCRMARWWFVQRVAITETAIQPAFKDGGESPRTNMAYSDTIKQSIKVAPKTLGNQLGRWAVHLDFPVIEVAKFTGATRQTVYNWFSGTDVTPAYRMRVQSLLNILQSSNTAEEAMRKCNRAWTNIRLHQRLTQIVN